MNILLTNLPLKRVASILPVLEEHGVVYLFAFAERLDSGEWDVVFSSSWSNENRSGAIGIIVDSLWPLLSSNERAMIGQIAVIPSEDPRLRELIDYLGEVTPADEKIVSGNFLGSDTRRSFVLKAQQPAPVQTAQDIIAARG